MYCRQGERKTEDSRQMPEMTFNKTALEALKKSLLHQAFTGEL
jgi:hypothetical protein